MGGVGRPPAADPRRHHLRGRRALDDAERWFGEADERARQSGNELEVADLHRLRARMLLDRSEPDDAAEAGELLQLALDDYVRFGMPSYAAVVEQMLHGTTGVT